MPRYVEYGYKDQVVNLLADADDKILWESMSYDDLDELISALTAVSREGREQAERNENIL